MPSNPERERLKKLYLPPEGEFTFVDVPEMPFAMIDGTGDPSGDDYKRAVRWLFTAILPMKRLARERMGKNFVAPPLECLYGAECLDDLIAGRREKLRWRVMVAAADWPDAADVLDEGAREAQSRLGEIPETLRLERFTEGRCVQILHVGDYRKAARALADRLHQEFLPANDLTAHGLHHEIYLSDPTRVALPKQKTVMRQPVK